jgi:hypothetical protein
MVTDVQKERWEPSPQDTMPYPGRNVSRIPGFIQFLSTLTALPYLHVLYITAYDRKFIMVNE